MSNEDVADPGTDAPADADVAGHIHPYLDEKMANARYQDHLAEVRRDQRAHQAQAGAQSGGILGKLRRRGQG